MPKFGSLLQLQESFGHTGLLLGNQATVAEGVKVLASMRTVQEWEGGGGGGTESPPKFSREGAVTVTSIMAWAQLFGATLWISLAKGSAVAGYISSAAAFVDTSPYRLYMQT